MMNRLLHTALAVGMAVATGRAAAETVVRFEATSPYHDITVLDQNGFRILSFDGTTETRMSLADPLKGHFEYTEYFHMPWLWNTQISRVLILGLGGGSTQRSFEHYYPRVWLDTVEIDPVVRQVAKDFFSFKESVWQRVHLEDGRVHLRRSQATYDVIIADAYSRNRYGSFIPPHLTTKEFFELAYQRLSTNGVMAYNVIGTLSGRRNNVVGSIYKTMDSVFPNVYLFPAKGSQNIVLIGTMARQRLTTSQLQHRADELVRTGRVTLPTFRTRVRAVSLRAPPSFQQARVLTDDFAPVESMMSRDR